MIFIAWFKFHTKTPGTTGYFTQVVEASNSDEALTKFKDRLLSDDNWETVKGDDEIFAHVTEIYLESLIGCPEAPQKPVIIHFMKLSQNSSGFLILSSNIPCKLDQDIITTKNSIMDSLEPFVTINSLYD